MNIDRIFKQTLTNRKVNANPNLFNRIEAGLNASAASGGASAATQAAGSVIAGATKAVIVSISAVALAVGGYFIAKSVNSEAKQPAVSTIVANDTAKESVVEPVTTEQITPSAKEIVKTEPANIKTDFSDCITEPDNNNTEIEFSNPSKSEPIATSQNYKTNIEKVTAKENNSEAVTTNSSVQTPKSHLQKTETPNLSAKLQIPNVITPNGDGINDFFVIGNLELYPDNVLVIWTRSGRQIFSASHYQNDWDAQNLPTGTYFYKLLLKTEDGKEIKAGVIEVLR
ncbi:MAG: gliding motility-associated C-terminal domain-containing protein [Bacteroidales bacterium]|jgi:gliding motility-associated-like protein|nr:gliding motility-associated C-terminal domain-containing protein [Bacteroidales bacterium]